MSKLSGGHYCVYNRDTKVVVLAQSNKTKAVRFAKEKDKSRFGVGISPSALVGKIFA